MGKIIDRLSKDRNKSFLLALFLASAMAFLSYCATTGPRVSEPAPSEPQSDTETRIAELPDVYI